MHAAERNAAGVLRRSTKVVCKAESNPRNSLRPSPFELELRAHSVASQTLHPEVCSLSGIRGSGSRDLARGYAWRAVLKALWDMT